MIFQPHNYQSEAIEFMLNNKQAAIFADPGLGKTAITLAVLNQLVTCKTLIIAPLRVCYNVWPQEIEKWSNFDHFSIQILHGKDKQKVDQTADICIINSENIFWLMRTYRLNFDTLIIDESSEFKNPGSKRFKALKSRLGAFKNRYILTGTPIPNGLLDLFSQMYIVEPNLLGKFITHYRDEYFRPIHFQNFTKWELRKGCEQKIFDRVAPKALRIDSSVLTLPGVHYHILYVEMPAKARTIYDKMEKELFAEIDGQDVRKLVKYNTCRQIANGFLYDEGETFELHDEKINALGELINELQGKPILVAYHYKQELKLLQKKFPKAPHIGSGVSQKKTSKIIKDWNAGKIQILFAHPQSMSMGLNLQYGPGRSICWFCLSDSLLNYIQFNKRLYRQGVRGDVNIYAIIARKTVDVAVSASLKNKHQTEQGFLDAIEKYRKEI